MLRCTSQIRDILHFERLVSWPHKPDECTERTREKVHIKCWVMSLRPWATGTQGQMGKWAIILIMLIRTLLTDGEKKKRKKNITYWVLIMCQEPCQVLHIYCPVSSSHWSSIGTATIPISQMRKIRFRDVTSLARWEMDLRRQCKQTNS